VVRETSELLRSGCIVAYSSLCRLFAHPTVPGRGKGRVGGHSELWFNDDEPRTHLKNAKQDRLLSSSV
jgi:hypothetical protein